MHIDEQFSLKAKEAIDKKGVIGPDVDLSAYDASPSSHADMADGDLLNLPKEEQTQLLMAGLDVTEKERGGTYLQMNTRAVHCHSSQDGIEVLSIQKALAEQPWVRDYYWKLADVGTDKYTAAAQLGLHDGYVIRSLPGSKSVYPIQACLYMHKDGMQQNVHNIIVAEEDSELHIISGCATSPHLKRGLHVGISEFFVKKNAKVTFTMIHNWAEEVTVRPRSVARVEKGGLFVNNYISMKPVRSIQMYPTTHLVGENAVARFYSIVVGSPGSEYDLGGAFSSKRKEIVRKLLPGPSATVERLSPGVIWWAKSLKSRHTWNVKDCCSMGLIHAIPELEGHVDGVEMSHEAAVGKIAQEESYLMSRGLNEEEATSTIVRGFLSVDIPGLPPQLQAEIDRAIEESDKDVM